MLGIISFKFTCQNVRSSPIPEVCAASSREGSMERSAADISRKARGMRSIPSTQIIPAIE